MANHFEALQDSGSDDEGGTKCQASRDAEKKFNDLFSSPTVTITQGLKGEVAALSKANFQTSSLGSMSSVLDSLAETAPAAISSEKKPKEHKPAWNFADLSNVNRVVDEKDRLTSKTRFNPLLNSTIAQHEKNVHNLMSAVQNSKYAKGARSKNACSRSRKANRRKAKLIQRGQAFSDKQEFRAGRSKKSRAGAKFKKSRHSPY